MGAISFKEAVANWINDTNVFGKISRLVTFVGEGVEVGNEDFLNATYFEVSHSIRDNSVTGNFEYPFCRTKFQLSNQNYKKITYILFESVKIEEESSRELDQCVRRVIETLFAEEDLLFIISSENDAYDLYTLTRLAMSLDNDFFDSKFLYLKMGSNNALKIEEESNRELDQCVHRVIETLFEEEDSLAILSSENDGYDLYTITNIRLAMYLDNDFFDSKFLYLKMGFVFYANDLEDVTRKIDISITLLRHHRNSNSNIKFFIITACQDISNFFLKFWKHQIMHVVVLVYSLNKNNSSLQLYTANPQATPNNCGESVNLVEEQNCKSEITFKFPRVMKKLTNCTFVVFAEYQITHKKQQGYVKAQYFIKLIASHLNSKVKHLDYSVWNRPEPNSNFVVRITFWRYAFTDRTSPVIYSEPVFWLVPKPKKMAPLKVVTVIFQKVLWCSILLSFLITTFTWWLISKSFDCKYGFTFILLNIWGATLFGSVNTFPSFRPLRFLLISYVIYCIHIQTLFTSKMLESLTIPMYERGIRNLEDLAKSNLSIIASDIHDYAVFPRERVNDTNLVGQISRLLKFVGEGVEVGDRFLGCVKNNECAAFFIGEEDFLNATYFEVSHSIRDNSVTGNFEYLFAVPNFSYVTEIIEKFTYILFESGVSNNFGKNLEIDKSKTEREPIVLKLEHVYIVFIFLVVGLVLSISNNALKIEEESNRELDECVHRVIENLFAEEDSLAILSSENDGYDLYTITNIRLAMFLDNDYFDSKFIYLKMGFVFYANDLEDVTRKIDVSITVLRHHRNSNSNIKFFIITSCQDISNFFLKFWKHQIMHVVVLVYSLNKNDSSLRLYTANPQAIPNSCGEAVNLVEEQNCKSEITFTFPTVMRKLTNCTFVVFAEYQITHEKQLGYVKAQYFIKLIASHLNSNVEHLNFSVWNRPEQNSNFVIRITFWRYAVTDRTSPVIYSEPVFWLVPKPKKMTPLKVITVIFQKILWCTILLSFLITTFAWWLILKLKREGTDCKYGLAFILLNVWGATLFGSINPFPSFRPLRFLLIYYIIYCIHIQTLFTSKLLESLTVPMYERGIRNLEDLAKSNLSIVASDIHYNTVFLRESVNDINLYGKISRLVKFVGEGDEVGDRFLGCVKKDECAAFFIGEEDFLNATYFELSHSIRDNSVTGNFEYLFAVPNFSYVTEIIEKFTYILFESGVSNNFGKKLEIDESKTEREPIVLKLEHVYVVFMFLVVEENNRELDQCVRSVTEILFSADDSLLVVTSPGDKYDLPNSIANPRLLSSIDNKNNLEKSTYFKMGVFFYVNNLEDLRQKFRFSLYSTTLKKLSNPHTKWLVVTSNPNISNYFLTVWGQRETHVVVLVSKRNKTDTILRLYTANPQAVPNNCGLNENLVIVQNCKSKFTFEFPETLRKYTNCYITFPLYVENGNDRRSSYIQSNFFKNLIVPRLNASRKRSSFPDFSIHLTILRNVTSPDIGPVICRDTVIWLVPKSREISAITLITAVFQKTALCLVVLGFLTTAFAWWIIIKLKNKHFGRKHELTLILLKIWNSTLFGSIYKIPSCNILRFLIISYIMYCFQTHVLFTSKLIQFLTVPQYERSIHSLEDLRQKFRFSLYSTTLKKLSNPHTKWLVVTSNPNISNYFLTVWGQRETHVVVLVSKRNKTDTILRLYTANPQAVPNNCGLNENLVIVQNCKSKFTFEFPETLRKYTNCYITFPLYVENGNDRRSSYIQSNFFKNLIVPRLNASRKRSSFPDFSIHLTILRNVTSPDIGPVICRDTVIWLVPKSREISAITLITAVFQKTALCLVVLGFLTTAFAWWIIIKLKNKHFGRKHELTLILLKIWNSTLFGSIYKIPSCNILRFLIISYIMYCFQTHVLFTSKLIQFLTVPQYERSIHSLEDLSESKLPIVVNASLKSTVFSYRYIYDHRYDKIFKSIHFVKDKRMVDVFFDCMKKRRCAAFFIDYEYYINSTFFELSHSIEDNSITGDLQYTFTVSYSRNYLTRTLNKWMYILIESGITNNFGVRLEIDQSKNDVLIPNANALTFDHIYIVCILLVVGLVFSVFVFVLELLVCFNN
ncbi:hypothetical protein FQR65_LT13266 [Abscondita terminalis]|nr:hypothetical protein FQR65_LT13266 [Abscondita terminalis]